MFPKSWGYSKSPKFEQILVLNHGDKRGSSILGNTEMFPPHYSDVAHFFPSGGSLRGTFCQTRPPSRLKGPRWDGFFNRSEAVAHVLINAVVQKCGENGNPNSNWIGWWENLQESPIFDGKNPWVSCKFSLKPIQWPTDWKVESSWNSGRSQKSIKNSGVTLLSKLAFLSGD